MHRTLIGVVILAALTAPVSAAPRSSTPPADHSAIHLDWAALPNAQDLERLYPPEAQARGVSGDTQIQCSVEPDGTLVACETLEEKPQGMGFAAAAIQASRRFRMTPYRAALVHGELPRVIVPIHWTVAPTPQTAPAPPPPPPPPSPLGIIASIVFVAVLGVVAVWLRRRSTNSEPPKSNEADGKSMPWHAIAWAGLLIGMMALLDVLSWIERGGTLSIVSALFSIRAKAPSIDVDTNGLRFSISVIVCLLVLIGCRLLSLRVSTAQRGQFTLIACVVLFGSFIVDEVYGERIITEFMTTHRYIRCSARDHVVGNGKGRVWFENYVTTAGNCRAKSGTDKNNGPS